MDLPLPVQEPANQQYYPHHHQPQRPAETVESKPEPADADDQFEEKRPTPKSAAPISAERPPVVTISFLPLREP
jgi:hypothetical protein